MAFTPCCLCSSSVLPSFTYWHVPTWFLLLPWPGLAVLPSGVSGLSPGRGERIWRSKDLVSFCIRCHLTVP
jgi:hypothetical protein